MTNQNDKKPENSLPVRPENEQAFLKEIYTQSNWNMRSYIVMRFRHFTSFAVVMAFLASAAFTIEGVSYFRSATLYLGLVMVILFWILDYRTGRYLSSYAKRVAAIEEAVFTTQKIDVEFDSLPNVRFLSSSNVTNLIFLFIFMSWCYVAMSVDELDFEKVESAIEVPIKSSSDETLEDIGADTTQESEIDPFATDRENNQEPTNEKTDQFIE